MGPEITSDETHDFAQTINKITTDKKQRKALTQALEKLFTGTEDYWERKNDFKEAIEKVRESLADAADKKGQLDKFSDDCLAEVQREYLRLKGKDGFQFTTLKKEGVVAEGSKPEQVDKLSPLSDGETRTFMKKGRLWGESEVGHITNNNKGQLTVSVSGKLSDLSDKERKALVDTLVMQSIVTVGSNKDGSFKMTGGTAEDALQAYDSMLKAGVKCKLEPITDSQWWTEFKQGPMMGSTGHAKPGQSAAYYSDLRKKFIDLNGRIEAHNKPLESGIATIKMPDGTVPSGSDESTQGAMLDVKKTS